MYAMRTHMVVALACALAGGCSTTPADTRPNLVGDMKAPSSQATTGSIPVSGYQLTDNELKYDCRKLTGMMQIRILQVRGYDSNKQASAAARGLQSFATPIWGGTKEGLDPEAQHRKDLAMLEAYNHRLAEKNCKTFDLAAELAATKDITPTPR